MDNPNTRFPSIVPLSFHERICSISENDILIEVPHSKGDFLPTPDFKEVMYLSKRIKELEKVVQNLSKGNKKLGKYRSKYYNLLEKTKNTNL